MKWLLLSNKVPYPQDDGHSVALAGMIKGLVANQQDVALFALNTSKHHRDLRVLPTWLEAIQFETAFINNHLSAAGAALNLLGRQSYFVSRFYSKSAAAQLEELIQSFQPDVLQVEGAAMGVYLPTIERVYAGPIIYRPHNVEHKIWQRQAAHESWPKRTYLRIQAGRLKRFENALAKKARAIMCISSADRQYFEGLGKPTFLVPPAQEAPKNPPFQGSLKTIFHIASFDWLPNQLGMEWFLKKVWPLVLAAEPHMQLLLAGRDIPQEWKLKYLKGITYLDYVKDPEQHYQKAALFIIPLLSGSGFRVKLLEALAHKKAVVSTALGALGADLIPDVHYLQRDSPEEFATALLQLSRNEQLAEEIATQGCQQVAEQFSPEWLGNQVVEHVRKLL